MKKQNNGMNNLAAAAVGVGVGVAAGVAAAVLTDEKKRKVITKDAQKMYKKGQEMVKNAINDAKDQAVDALKGAEAKLTE